MDTVTLYRPTGPEELKLVEASGFRRWPPRLPEQPIFYPVTNERYAAEIASRWNLAESGTGFVTRFEVKREFMDRDEVQTVGASHDPFQVRHRPRRPHRMKQGVIRGSISDEV